MFLFGTDLTSLAGARFRRKI